MKCIKQKILLESSILPSRITLFVKLGDYAYDSFLKNGDGFGNKYGGQDCDQAYAISHSYQS